MIGPLFGEAYKKKETFDFLSHEETIEAEEQEE